MSQMMPPYLAFSKNQAGRVAAFRAVGAEADHVDDPADGPGLDQLVGVGGGLHVQALAVVDHVLATGLGHHALGLVELVERGEGRLVGEVILAMFHHPAAQRAAQTGHGGGGHQGDRGIGEHLVEAPGDPDLGKHLEKCRDPGGFRIVDPGQTCAGADQAAALVIDVRVVQVNRGKGEFPGSERGSVRFCGVWSGFMG